MIDSVLLSLKGEAAVWRGLGDTSTVLPAPCLFSRLQGLYPSRDGSALRRAPGHRLGGRPFFGQEYAIGTIEAGTPSRITLNSGVQVDNLRSAANNDQGWHQAGASALRVYILDSGNPDVPDGLYTATRTGDRRFTLDGVTVTNPSTGGVVLIQRVSRCHALTSVAERVVAVCQTSTWQSSGTVEASNVSSAVSSGPLSFTDPPGPGRQAAYGTEAGFVFWPSPTLTGMTDGEGDDTATNPVRKAAQNLSIPRRITCDVSGQRVVIAVPGQGVLYQAHLGAGPPWMPVRPPDAGVGTGPNYEDLVPNHRWTKALGIPRGQIRVLTSDTPTGTFYFGVAVAYMDLFTDEVGLISEVAVVRADDASDVQVQVPYPRALLYETCGLGAVIFVTAEQASAEAADSAELFPVVALGPWATFYDYGVLSDFGAATYTEAQRILPAGGVDAGEIQPRFVPFLEQMPLGGSTVKVVRGRVLSAQGRPLTWEMGGWPNYQSHPTFTDRQQRVLGFPYEAFQPDQIDAGPCSHGIIPPSYAGYRVIRKAWTANGFLRGLLLERLNHRNISGVAVGGQVWECDYDAGTLGSPPSASNPTRAFVVKNDPLLVGVTEEGVPSSAPANGRLPIDAVHGSEVVGIGRIGSAAIVCTEFQTVLYAWSTMPTSQAKTVLSTQHGCASAASMVDGPFGAAWLSREGPVLCDGGSVRWIGDKVLGFWDTVAKDVNGDVHYASGTIDLRRELVIWAVRTTALDDASDLEGSAKARADTLLCWHWPTQVFSTIDMGDARRVDALGVLPFRESSTEQPTARVTFSMSSGAIEDQEDYHGLFGWDESAGERAASATNLTIAAARNGSSTTVTVASGLTGRVAGDHAMIRSADGSKVRWFGTLASVTSDTTCAVASADGATWQAGDVLVIGVVAAGFTTQWLRFPDDVKDGVCEGIHIVATVAASHAYARVRLSNDDGDDVDLGLWGKRMTTGKTEFRKGRIRGRLVKVAVDVYADGQFTIDDVLVEVHRNAAAA